MRGQSNLRVRIAKTRYSRVRTFRKLTGLEHVFKLKQQLKKAKKDVRILKREQKQMRKDTCKIQRETRRLQELNNQMAVDLEAKTEELRMLRIQQTAELDRLSETLKEKLVEIRRSRQVQHFGEKSKYCFEIKLQVV